MQTRTSLFSYSYLLSLSFNGKAICRAKNTKREGTCMIA